MDLGCIYQLCKPNDDNTFVYSEKKLDGTEELGVTATSKAGKNGASKEPVHSILNSVNKHASQIRKTAHRKSSPLNWFPRKKTDSFLKRKIRLLQEVGGMNSTLDETLGDSNLHYSRIAREKIAAREAACKAMEARKAAMVEASWCRILLAARIQSKEAEFLLTKAKKSVAEAFEAAAAMGVTMYDRPDCPRKRCEIETSATAGGGSTHTVTASFETAFEVDKQVAAAVKTALIQVANCPSSLNKDEFKGLLRKISQNPDTTGPNQELLDLSSECESDTGSELESETHVADLTFSDDNNKIKGIEMGQRKPENGQIPANYSTKKSSKAFMKLANMMLERLKCLHENELASLATIVATCGLSAALLEVENSKQYVPGSSTESNIASYFMDGQIKQKQDVTEVPSLDKFLVKHVSRLEREVQEAKNTRKKCASEESGKTLEGSGVSGEVDSNTTEKLSEAVASHDKILVKHISRLEPEVEEAKNSRKNFAAEERGKTIEGSSVSKDAMTSSETVPDLGSALVKHVSWLEKDVEEAKGSAKAFEKASERSGSGQDGSPHLKMGKKTMTSLLWVNGEDIDKENVDLNKVISSSIRDEEISQTRKVTEMMDGLILSRSAEEKVNPGQQIPTNFLEHDSRESLNDSLAIKHVSRIERAKLEALEAFSVRDVNGKNETSGANGLDKIFLKPVHRLEREKMAALALERGHSFQREQKKQETEVASESLDKVLVKHVSRLRKEKMAMRAKDNKYEDVKVGKKDQRFEKCGDSLDEILVKHQSRLEKEKLASAQQPTDHIKHSETRRLAREREMQEAWGGLSLGNSKDEDRYEDVIVGKKDQQFEKCGESLDEILVKHQSRLEKEKLASAQQPTDYIKPSEARRLAREREMQEAWGGLSLGNSVRPHLSRLERDKAAWKRAEEEEREH